MYFLARAFFRSAVLGAFSAVLLALTPAHFIHSRFAMDYLYPVPFVILWLLAFRVYETGRRPAMLFAATLSLGLGFYSYIAAVLMMPLYFALTRGRGDDPPNPPILGGNRSPQTPSAPLKRGTHPGFAGVL